MNLSWDPKLAPSSLTYLDYRHDVLTRDGATAPDQYKANTLRRERAFLSMMHGTRDHGGLEKGGVLRRLTMTSLTRVLVQRVRHT